MTKSNQSSLDIADHLSRGEYDWCPEAETRLREQHDLIRQQQAKLDKYKQVLQSIANEHTELSHDKIKWQCEDHVRWAKEALK